MPVSLVDADNPALFGGKASQLARAVRAGLAVPPGVALAWPLVDAVATGQRDAVEGLAAAASLGAFVAVRSSAVGEDSETTSFAGQHLSLLHVPLDGLAEAVTEVRRSVHGEGARAYRERVGVVGAPRAGVVIQRMVDADVAGVAFWPNPVSRADEIVIECAWGLGEAVAGGLVVPDLVRLTSQGQVLERRAGVKDLVVAPATGGGTVQRAVAAARATSWCLDPGALTALCELTRACRDLFGGPQDLEWAVAERRVWLLQRRAVTTGA